MSLLKLTGLSHGFGDQTLYKNASFSLYKGEHVGIVGQNGAGKSTLIKILAGTAVPDSGQIAWAPGTVTGYLDQYAELKDDVSIVSFLRSAFAPLYEVEQTMNALYSICTDCGSDTFHKASRLQSHLEAAGFYDVDTNINKVSGGLGLLALGLDRSILTLSGGQRAKVILAKLLLQNPDVLLLDEPTNFLDKEHIQWLAAYLAASPKAFLTVSHDSHFLEEISTHILDIDDLSLNKYTGKYSAFLKQKEHHREDYVRRYRAQKREIEKTEAYIRKNIAGVNSKNAKGRRKQLQRMEKLPPPEVKEVKPEFHFRCSQLPAQDILIVNNLTVGYGTPLLSGLSFLLKTGQKIVLTGFNGIGKSTLLKTLMGEVTALGGSFAFAQGVKNAYYAQDLIWENDNLTPLALVSGAFPDLNGKAVREQLFRCGIPARLAVQQLNSLSGGEQAKVKLCLLTLTPCSLLILDEPTNHLDALAKDALAAALTCFSGAVLLVSHEEAFYKSWADKVLDIGEL